MNHRTFNLEKHSLVPYLTNKNYHVYSIDLRGAGESYHDLKSIATLTLTTWSLI